MDGPGGHYYWIFALAPPEPGQELMWPCMSNSPNEGLENGNSLGFDRSKCPFLQQFYLLELHQDWTGFDRQAQTWLREACYKGSERGSIAARERHLQPSSKTLSHRVWGVG